MHLPPSEPCTLRTPSPPQVDFVWGQLTALQQFYEARCACRVLLLCCVAAVQAAVCMQRGRCAC